MTMTLFKSFAISVTFPTRSTSPASQFATLLCLFRLGILVLELLVLELLVLIFGRTAFGIGSCIQHYRRAVWGHLAVGIDKRKQVAQDGVVELERALELRDTHSGQAEMAQHVKAFGKGPAAG